MSVNRSTFSGLSDRSHPSQNQALLMKQALAKEIVRIVRQRNWTQQRAAERLRLDQPKVSALSNGRLNGFSIERLVSLLERLDRKVDFTVTPVHEVKRFIRTPNRVFVAEACGDTSKRSCRVNRASQRSIQVGNRTLLSKQQNGLAPRA